MKTLAIYTQKKDLDTFLYLSKFITEMERRNIKCVLFAEMIETMKFSAEFETFSNKQDLQEKFVELVFTFGGDGTIVTSLLYVQDSNIPIVGVNTG